MKKLLLILGIGLLSLTGCEEDEVLHQHNLVLYSTEIDSYKIEQVCIHHHYGGCPYSYNDNFYDENHRYDLTMNWKHWYDCTDCNYMEKQMTHKKWRFDTRKEAKDFLKTLIN